ncbi:hypothetical protein [Thermococcus camini]|uniref:Uncharacterized protein n=1 Tax=Thermococcus camini TaxID=2016373 RepID=A0A7G2DB50_9EURY|nr:hypothetical protein [Thermococcus camini]CAD5245220.1 conserved exported protein of unknown function [Thermococcus camini]
MRRSNKKRLIPLALALVLALVGAALAVPTINMNIQSIGAGKSNIPNPVVSATFNWQVDSTDPDQLTQLDVTIDLSQASLNSGTLYIKFYKGDTYVGKISYDLSTTPINDGDTLSITAANLQSAVGASGTTLEELFDKFDTVAVVYVGPQQ